MAAHLLDSEFMEYWAKLSVVQKESLLSVARNYVQSPDTAASVAELRKKMILQDRQHYLQGKGTTYSWEQVKQMALNKEKRNGLLA